MGLRFVSFASRRALGWRLCVFAGLGCLSLPFRAAAVEPTVEDLQGLSIEDLANVQVTSVSKRPEALGEAPAAIYVITADDIRRSGATSLPEALRLAPNLEVARMNASSWTVTARGFNSPETANKLLVLVNGRSVYEPIGGGVLWQQVDVDLPNIERIEVISGPGGTLWGANAVNGVINVITKDVTATQGPYLQVSGGNFDNSASFRYGGKVSDHIMVKVLADTFSTDATTPAQSGPAPSDAFRGVFGGVGFTGTWDADVYTMGASLYDNRVADGGGRLRGSLVRLGWTRQMDNGSTVSGYATVTHDDRSDPTLYESRDSVVLAAQQAVQVGTRQQFVWGGEYRYWWEDFVSFNAFHFANPKTNIALGSLFAQDQITLRSDLKLILGLKGEYNSYSGFEWLPNLRLAWQPDDDTLVWGAVSRSVRTPNRIERELEASPFLVPSPDFQSEKLVAYEAGWRDRPTKRVSVSLSAFYNQYDGLRTDQFPVAVFPLMLANGGRGETYGLEGWGKFAVTDNWRLSAGFNTLHKHFSLKPGYNDLTALAVQGLDPLYQAQVRSEWNVNRNFEFDLSVRNVGKVDRAPVPAYTEANAHVEWRLTDKMSVAVDGLNLLHKQHLEVWDPSTAAPRYVPRSLFVTLRFGG
jgi:iron complex outermembrane receptor protein